MKRTGLLHLYYGDGKGKTTAAMGLALRAMGSGKRVVILQFLKGGKSGEVPLLEQLGAKVYRGKAGQKFVFQMNEAEKEATRQLQNANLTAAMAAPADLLILDEAGSAWELDMVDKALLQKAVLEKALDAACAVPLEVMEKCAEGIALVEEYAAKGSVMAVSDAGCAAALCKAALQAASLNVFINTKLMADRERAAALDAKTDKLLDEFVSRADAVFASVTNKLRNK